MNILIRIVLGLFLLLAGYFSSFNAEIFEYIFVDAAWSTWFLSPYISRAFTASSMALGLIVLLGVGNRQMVYKSALLLSMGFLFLSILEPTWLGLTRCYGCLAEFNKVSRYQGILLWSIASIFAFILLKKGTIPKGWQLPKWTVLIVLILTLPIPFIINYPAHWAVYGEQAEIPMKRDLQLARLDTVKIIPALGGIPKDLTQGKKIFCVATLSCPFCNRLAYKLHVIKKYHPEFPVFVLLSGEIEGLPSFLKRNRFNNVPFYFMNNNLIHEFTEGSVPRIYLLENGIATKEINYWALNPGSI
jgi:hypothetical protein